MIPFCLVLLCWNTSNGMVKIPFVIVLLKDWFKFTRSPCFRTNVFFSYGDNLVEDTTKKKKKPLILMINNDRYFLDGKLF